MPRLHIGSDSLAAVEKRAAEAFPTECCGLLLGQADEGETVRVGRAEPCVNEASERGHRFAISAEALLAAYRRARELGERVVGTYHSHPGGAAVPSALDRASAWPGASYLIVGLGEEGVRERRSWRLAADGFVEEELLVGNGERLEEEYQ